MTISSRLERRKAFWVAALIVAVAAIGLRVYALDRLPPGLFGDEAVEGLDALDVLAGNWAIWFHAHLGREPIFVYLVAISYWAFGITPLATRLPAVIAGIVTIPATFLFAREWGRQVCDESRATRTALLATALITVSFWHIQMTRDAHRGTLLPLVLGVGYWLLWRARRTRAWKTYAAAGAVLGLAIYTYSPGRFVAVFVLLFFVVEFIAGLRANSEDASTGTPSNRISAALGQWSLAGLVIAAFMALGVMLPLGLYFVQNPAQFSRRFESVSVLDAESPPIAFASSVAGNLAQYVIPGAGYQSKHYNLPGKPIFDMFLAPWFVLGLGLALARWRQSAFRFVILWFAVMMAPAFLTADMIPKAVRALGVLPGVFIFPAVAMDWLLARLRSRRTVAIGLIAVSMLGSTIWTAYDYFVAWANMPELPLAFDSDMTEVAAFIRQQPADQPIYISTEVYRPPTEMLIGRRVPTSRYVDRATGIRELDARTTLASRADGRDPIYIFVRDRVPPETWLGRLTQSKDAVGEGVYFSAFRLRPFSAPKQALAISFNPYLKLVGFSRYSDEPSGIVLYWQVTALPDDREDIQSIISFGDVSGATVTQGKQQFGVPPLEWGLGDTIVEWYGLKLSESATQFNVEMARRDAHWQSAWVPLR